MQRGRRFAAFVINVLGRRRRNVDKPYVGQDF